MLSRLPRVLAPEVGVSERPGPAALPAPVCSLAQRYPVQVRPRPPPLPGQQQQDKQPGGSGGGKKGQ